MDVTIISKKVTSPPRKSAFVMITIKFAIKNSHLKPQMKNTVPKVCCMQYNCIATFNQ